MIAVAVDIADDVVDVDMADVVAAADDVVDVDSADVVAVADELSRRCGGCR